MSAKPYSVPSKVSAEGGEVVVDGPNGFALSFTPGAAIETSDRLLDAATEAKGQQLMKRAAVGERD